MILALNNLFKFLPEPLWLLIFGVALIAFTGVLRRIFNRGEQAAANGDFGAGEQNERGNL